MERHKLATIVKAFPEAFQISVLDIGCRSQVLQELLSLHVKYLGLDLCLPATVLGNLEQGLAFRDGAFHCVVALDVLEHTNNIHLAFRECARVTSRYLVIGLPNLYEFRMRLAFLIGKQLSGKYVLPLEVPYDRHRWLFSFNEARRFVQYQAQKHGFLVRKEAALIGPNLAKYGGQLFTSLVPNLLARWYLAILAKS
jgi:hypothetical protein